jgi:hypothetical protein
MWPRRRYVLGVPITEASQASCSLHGLLKADETAIRPAAHSAPAVERAPGIILCLGRTARAAAAAVKASAEIDSLMDDLMCATPFLRRIRILRLSPLRGSFDLISKSFLTDSYRSESCSRRNLTQRTILKFKNCCIAAQISVKRPPCRRKSVLPLPRNASSLIMGRGWFGFREDQS